MTDEEILTGIEEVARASAGYTGRLEPATRVVEDLGLDSLELLNLAMELEHRFGIVLDDLEPASIGRVADLVQAIRSKLGG